MVKAMPSVIEINGLTKRSSVSERVDAVMRLSGNSSTVLRRASR